MTIIRSITKMQKLARKIAGQGQSIGLVPTMGFLHEGHLSLIRKAKQKTDVVITSIFVNPTQFSPNEDLSKYPRDEKGDIRKIVSAGGEVVFIPKADEIYPDDFQTYVTVEKLTQTLEGAARPTHFRGVTTIVAKLFNITRPDVAVFGMKDFQQSVVLKRMAADLGYPIKFIIAPTVRLKSGLALSSRNKYFSTKQLPQACCLYHALAAAKALVRNGGTSAARLKKEMQRVILTTCPSAQVDYVSFNSLVDLSTRTRIVRGTICSLAVRVHGVRLIDNMRLA